MRINWKNLEDDDIIRLDGQTVCDLKSRENTSLSRKGLQ